MRKTFLTLAATVLVSMNLLFVAPATAQVDTGLTSTASQAGLLTSRADLPTTVGTYIKALLGLLGVVFLILLIYAGVLWMTARGDEDKVKHARDIIINAVIGLIIIFLAYAITSFVINSIVTSTQASP